MRQIAIIVITLVFGLAYGQALAAKPHPGRAGVHHVAARHVHHRHAQIRVARRSRAVAPQTLATDRRTVLADRFGPTARPFNYHRELTGGGVMSVGAVHAPVGPVIDPRAVSSAAAAQPNPAGTVAGVNLTLPF